MPEKVPPRAPDDSFRARIDRVGEDTTLELHVIDVVRAVRPMLSEHRDADVRAYYQSDGFKQRDPKERAYGLLYAYFYLVYEASGEDAIRWIRTHGFPEYDDPTLVPRVLMGDAYNRRRTLSGQLRERVGALRQGDATLLAFIEKEFSAPDIQIGMSVLPLPRQAFSAHADGHRSGRSLQTLLYYSATGLSAVAKYLQRIETTLIDLVKSGDIPASAFAAALERSMDSVLYPIATHAVGLEEAVLSISRFKLNLHRDDVPHVTFDVDEASLREYMEKFGRTEFASNKRGRCPALFLTMFKDVLDAHVAYRRTHPPDFQVETSEPTQ